MLIFVWILGMLGAMTMLACYYRKIEAGRLVIVGTGIYFSLFVIMSGILIWIDRFSLLWATALVLVIEIVLTLAKLFLSDFSLPKILPAWKKYLPIAILLIVCAFLSGEKAGVYGTGQDQGLYQIRAMLYMGGYNQNVVDFSEYDQIESGAEREHYVTQLKDMEGYYLLSKDQVAGAGDCEGVLHGNGTFPAMLALWGKMFGLSNMTGILTIFYLLAIANTWLICDNLRLKRTTSLIAAVFMGICPIVLWCSKNTLTEMFFTSLICIFIELLTENPKKKIVLWSAVPMVAAAFYHVTISIFMPLVVLLYLLGYLQSKNRKMLYAMILSLVGYAAGMNMMMKTARHYTLKNLDMLFGRTKNILNAENIQGVIWGIAIVLSLAAIVLLLREIRHRIFRGLAKFKKSIKINQFFGIGVSVITALLIFFFIYKGFKAAHMGMWPMKLSILGYLFMTGFVMLPAAFLSVFINGRKMLRKRNTMVIGVSLLYILFVYCGILWVLIYYYYYYARYFAPFVVFILVAAAMFWDRISVKITIPLLAVFAGLVIWQSNLLYTEKDLTYCDYSIVESMTSCVNSKDAILVMDWGYHIQRIYAMALKGTTGADIFFVTPDLMPERLAICAAAYENVFLLQYDLGYLTEDTGEWRYVYQGMMHTSIYENYIDRGLPYAKKNATMDSPVALMIYNRD